MTAAHIVDAFWARVAKGQPDECWPWQGHKGRGGYGRIQIRRRMWRAHRLAWWVTHGELEPSSIVLHTCDNPPCCNPAHLSMGTVAQNNADRAAKGRSATGDRHPARIDLTWSHGERNPGAKLTAAQVAVIQERYANGGVFQYQLATEYGVTQGTIHKIVAGKTWMGDYRRTSRLKETGVHGNAHEGNSSAKLTMAQANEIRARYAIGGVTQQELGRQYGVSQGIISKVLRGKSWT